ncbi:MAG: hypothetical protein QM760_01350 [Nibricoccus sp.]
MKILAWAAIVISTLLLPVSLITLLMVIAGSEGTKHATLSGFLFVVARPPATLIAGIGLLRRWRWSYRYTLAILASFAVWHAILMIRGPVAEHTYISPGGVPTTVLASSVNYPLHLMALALTIGAFVKLTARSVRAEFGYGPRAAEKPLPSSSPAGGSIRRIAYSSPEKHSFDAMVPVSMAPSDARAGHSSLLQDNKRSQSLALLTAIAVMTLIAAGMGWLVHNGIATDETYFPTKSASHRRTVQRAQEPVVFWVSIGIYAALSAGSAGLAAWGAREAIHASATSQRSSRELH